MKPLILPIIEDYAEEHSSPEGKIFKDLVKATKQKTKWPQMQVGHLEGNFLRLMVKVSKAKRILEIGTFTGYSALCLAEGLDYNGKLITIDINDELTEMVQRFIDKSKFQNQIEAICGDALEIIPKLNLKFDLVFIDADNNLLCLKFNFDA